MNINESNYSEPSLIADLFNNFLVNILFKSLDSVACHSGSKESSMFFSPVCVEDVEEVSEAFISLKNKNTIDIDGVSTLYVAYQTVI